MAEQIEGAPSTHGEGVTILVVSDDLYNAFTLQRRLESRKYEVVTAASEEAAIDAAKEQLPELILIDVTTDQLDGLAVKEALNATPDASDIPVVFLSNRNRLDFIVQAYELGAEGLLAKPFHLEELFARASIIVGRRQRQKKLAEEIARLAEQLETGGVAVEDEEEMRNRLDESIHKADQRRQPISCLHVKVAGLYELNNPPLARQVPMDVGQILHHLIDPDTDTVTALPGQAEFVLHSLGLSIDRAMVLAEGVRSTIEIQAFAQDGLADQLAIAIGIAGRDAGSDVHSDQVLEGAEQAMQSAVEAGGGRTVIKRLAT